MAGFLSNIFKRKEDEVVAPGAAVAVEGRSSRPIGEITAPMVEFVKDTLAQILQKMGFQLQIESAEVVENQVRIALSGEDDIGRVIGKEGSTLYSLQKLLVAMASKKFEQRIFVQIDANDYRKRREKSLSNIATNAARMAITEQTEVVLDPMNNEERRLVHLALESHPDVHTYSTGSGYQRQVVVAPGPKPANLPEN
jgi:spoIIIJ-associated protein